MMQMTIEFCYKNNQLMVPDTSTMSSRRIVGYFANWKIYGRNFPVNKIQAANYTHVDYCFFGISSSTNQLISLDPWADFHADNGDNSISDARKPSDGPGSMNDLYRLKKSNPGLKLAFLLEVLRRPMNFQQWSLQRPAVLHSLLR